MTTPYQKGVRVERLLKQELEAQGWTVIRSAGSHGPADLVAYREPGVMFIQIKRCRSVPELKRAIRGAIDKFESTCIWWSDYVSFQVWLRYRRSWINVWRGASGWYGHHSYVDLLGQTEWSILEQEV